MPTSQVCRGSEMTETVCSFPITGNKVSEVLRGALGADEMWLVSHMDVPSGIASSTILSGLREGVASGPVKVSTGDLCDALVGAPQVWVLDIRLSSGKDVQLYIEDGGSSRRILSGRKRLVAAPFPMRL